MLRSLINQNQYQKAIPDIISSKYLSEYLIFRENIAEYDAQINPKHSTRNPNLFGKNINGIPSYRLGFSLHLNKFNIEGNFLIRWRNAPLTLGDLRKSINDGWFVTFNDAGLALIVFTKCHFRAISQDIYLNNFYINNKEPMKIYTFKRHIEILDIGNDMVYGGHIRFAMLSDGRFGMLVGYSDTMSDDHIYFTDKADFTYNGYISLETPLTKEEFYNIYNAATEKKLLNLYSIPSFIKSRRLFMLRVKGINIIDLNNIKENIGHKHTQTDITDRSCIFQDCVKNYTAAKSIKIPKYINYCVIKYTCFTPTGTSKAVTAPIMVVNYIGSLPPKSNVVLWGYVINTSFTVDTSNKSYEENYNPKNTLQQQNTLVYDGEDSNYCYYHIQGDLGNDNILFINAEKKASKQRKSHHPLKRMVS